MSTVYLRWHAMRNLSNAEAILDGERKHEGSHELVAGRIAELRHLEAGERGLAEAYNAYAHHADGATRFLGIAGRHLEHAALLAGRIEELGGHPALDGEDYWILHPPTSLAALIEAENAAHRGYHDHLLDLDPETMRLVRDRILAEHEDTLAQLTGERPDLLVSLESG